MGDFTPINEKAPLESEHLLEIICVFYIFAHTLVIGNSNTVKATPPLNPYRILLTKLRGGDYAHAGDKAAIDLVLNKAIQINPNIIKGPTLDIGSGLGGTANYLSQHNFKDIYCIDLDTGAIQYTKAHYSHLNCQIGNILQLSNFYPANHFRFTYLFNVLYAIEDKHLALQEIVKITAPQGIIAIFDYTLLRDTLVNPLYDFAGKQMYPLQITQLKETLQEIGWEIVEIQDLTPQFIEWYEDFLKKLDDEEPNLLKTFDQEHIDKVRKTFVFLLDYLKSKTLGGIVIYAKRTGHL